MKIAVLRPIGWPCTLAECPPGPLVMADMLCFKELSDGHVYDDRGVHMGGESTNLCTPVELIWKDVK